MEDIVINGKIYPMWQQFVQKKDEWIKGTLTDLGDKFDKMFYPAGEFPMETIITDITLTMGSPDSAILIFHGKDFDCGSDSQYLCIIPDKDCEGLKFGGFAGHEWIISKS